MMCFSLYETSCGNAALLLEKETIERSEEAASLSTSKKESGGVDIKFYNVF